MNQSDKEHLSKVSSLGCIVCRNEGLGATPPEVHHIRSVVGVGQRASHKQTIPLCHTHHRTGGHGVAFHAGKKVWEDRFGTEEELLSQTMKELEMLELDI